MSELAKLKDQLSEAFGPTEADAVSPVVSKTTSSPDAGVLPFYNKILRRVTLFTAGCGFAFASAVYLGGDAALYMAAISVAICVSCAFYMMVRSSMLRQASMRDATVIEARQRQNAALMAEIHEAMGDIVVTRDLERRILQTNTAFCEMTGCASPQGKTCEEIGIAFRPGGKAHCYDVEIATPYGQRIFTWHDVVANDATSSRLVINSIARDVTDERAAIVSREDARVRAENANAAKGRLLATVSHEIRLPLSGILGMNHLLSQTKLNHEQRNYLNGMRESGQALVQLVEDLLDFSTMEAGRFRLNPRAENLRQLIESVVEMLAHRAHEKGIEIASIVTPDVPDYLDFDPARLRQVLFNLIGNAVKFTSKGGVLVQAQMADGELSIAVEDTGPGMSGAEQARIFGEFEQAGPTSQRSAGTGLGLAISARIIREFGGALKVASQKGKGSVFTLTFKPAPLAQTLSSDRAEALRKANVLLLSPSGTVAKATVASVEALGGSCLHASTRRELDALRNRSPDAFQRLTDIIIDHRVAPLFQETLETWPTEPDRPVKRVLLVNPEERAAQKQDAFDAWLIRPLREKSLTDVLSGRFSGVEGRDAINDNHHPGFGFASVLDDTAYELDVLVAEDDPVNLRILRAVLEKSGCKVRSVADFTGLTQSLASGPDHLPDLVISDLNMPGGDGIDVLPDLCALLRASNVPLIVLSADTTPGMQSILLAGGVDIVLAKPVEPKRLIEEVLRLFPQKGTGRF